MPLLPSLPDTAHLTDLLVRFPQTVEPLMTYIQVVLRGDGDLTVGERELIAAYVSGLNACTFCHGSHAIYAEAFGIPASVIGKLLADPGAADIDDKLRPLLAYAAKLNTLPSKMVSADAEAVFAAGWSERALFETIQITGVFNMMNRLIEGAGVNFDYAAQPDVHTIQSGQSGDPEALKDSYSRYGAMVVQMAAEDTDT